MRKNFSIMLHEEMATNHDIHLLTADLGYGLWDSIKIDYPDRFHDFGSSEQLMVGAAVGMAMENKLPICYSITPFLLYRPFEFIRNYINKEKIVVKLVGGGRNKDYGHLGFSHWAEDDIKILENFKNIEKIKPKTLTSQIFKDFINQENPSYINLSK
jgi:transketolase